MKKLAKKVNNLPLLNRKKTFKRCAGCSTNSNSSNGGAHYSAMDDVIQTNMEKQYGFKLNQNY